MGSVLLLVTGSRALCDTPAAERWALRHLDAALSQCPALVVTGDAPGPDTWARFDADRRAIDRRVYALDGWVYSPDPDGLGTMHRRWTTDAAGGQRKHGRRWPLERNRVMVGESIAAAVHRYGGMHVLALRAPWSRTNGTGQTVGLCEGLTITDLTCPAELGPSAEVSRG